MKISKASNSKQTSSIKKNNPSKSGEFAEQVRGVGSTETIDSGQASEGVSTIGSLDSILAAQEVSDSTDEHSKGALVQYGDQLLNYLDEIKLDILNGAIPKEKLTNLAQILRQNRQVCDDHHLNSIIDEVELRVEVEVAKFTRNH
tara:strand:- start:58 stop:492 length:435 start_codon:yes stop_codon:yes gene_type:complete